MGVGAAKPHGRVDKVVAERIVWAWVLTIPFAGGLAYGFLRLLQLMIPS
jgi:PiT family inorganic phosphate transporter